MTSALAEAIYDLVEELETEAGGDDQVLAELLPPHLLALFVEVIGEPRARAAFGIQTDRAPTAFAPARLAPKAKSPEAVPCSRFTVCGQSAIEDRWDPVSCEWRPVCRTHLAGATPFERRPLTPMEARRAANAT